MNHEAWVLIDRLVKARCELGETQANFAARFGISLSCYGRWERHGPPNTPAHRGFIRLMLRYKIYNAIKVHRRQKEARRARRIAAARAAESSPAATAAGAHVGE
jgi:DNA-binding XRE family transcriptional regulator